MKYIILIIIPVSLLIILTGCVYRIKNDKVRQVSLADNKQSISVNEENNKITGLSQKWDEMIKSLQVPSVYSDLCGYGEDGKCSEFSFVNGELPENLKDNLHGEKDGTGNASIDLLINKATAGVFDVDGKKFDLIVVPYYWSWASSGQGLYVVKENNERAGVIARVSVSKHFDLDLVEINNNRIKINYTDLSENKKYSKICVFIDNQFSEKYLRCIIQDSEVSSDGNMLVSPNGKYGVFLVDAEKIEDKTSETVVTYNEIWMFDFESEKKTILIKSGKLNNLKIANVNKDNFPFEEIHDLTIGTFSNDSRFLYFTSGAWVTSDALFVVDLVSKSARFITDTNYIEVVKSGAYKDMLITNHHRYYENGGGAYDHYFVTDPRTGKDIKDLGNSKL